jgi:hypothetical protein
MKRNGAASDAAVTHPARVTMTRRKSNVTAHKPFVNDTARATYDRAVLLEAFVAEFTSAAYHVALRHGAGTWLDLQLRLWHTLADTVEHWARKSSPGQVPRGLKGLTRGATSTATPATPGLH